MNHGGTPDRPAAKAHIAAAREQLQALEKRQTLDGLSSAVMQHVLGALSELGEAQRLLSSGNAPADPARPVCPHCGLSVTATAAICSFCWHEITPTAKAP